jgi:CRISPR/Cas system-associated exonuclease Cas4 (RecB family)
VRKLSATQIGTYRRCAMQYWWRYVAGVKMRPDVGLLKGRSVHKGVEVGYRSKQETGEDPPEEMMMEATSAEFNAVVGTATFENDDPKPGEVKDRSLRLTQLHRHAVMPDVLPAMVEYEMRFPITETVELSAYADVISADAIRDTKTSARTESEEAIKTNAQLAYYVIGAEREGLPIQQIGLDRLIDTKTPKVQQVTLSRAEVDTERAIHVAQGVANGIEHDLFVPVDDQRICSWCGFRDTCIGKPIWKYLADPELAKREARKIMAARMLE